MQCARDSYAITHGFIGGLRFDRNFGGFWLVTKIVKRPSSQKQCTRSRKPLPTALRAFSRTARRSKLALEVRNLIGGAGFHDVDSRIFLRRRNGCAQLV